MSAEEILAKRRETNRLRQQRFYLANKERINAQRRENTKLLRELKKGNVPHIQTIEPMIQQPAVEPLQPKDIVLPQVLDSENIQNLLLQLRANGVIKTDGTLQKYIGDVKRLLVLTKCDNLNTCLKKPKEIIQLIDESTFSINTKKSLYQTIVYLIDKLELPYSKTIFNQYKAKFDVYKLKSVEQSEEKTVETSITFPEYLEKVKEKFGEQSKMYLLSKLYDEVTVRDDFQLQLVSSLKDTEDNKINYIVVPSKSSSQLIVVLNNYKTSTKFGKIEVKLSKQLTTMIRNYIKDNNLQIGDYLFGKKKLTSFVQKSNSKIGVVGGTNLFRHMKVTELYKPDMTHEQRVELANQLLHSPIVQLRYLRNQ